MRRTIAIAGLSAAALLGGSAAGLVLFTPGLGAAQEAPADPATSSTTTTGSTTPEAGERGQWVQDALAGLVESGVITQAQADAVADALEAAKPEHPGGRGRHGGRGLGTLVEPAATALGMEAGELLTQLRDGTTIAEIATEKNVELQKVIDAIVADVSADLDQAVADGKLTQAEADERKADLPEKVTAFVNGERPERDGPGRGQGPHGGVDDDADAEATTS